MRRVVWLVLVLAWLGGGAYAACAQALPEAPQPGAKRHVRVGVYVAPPFLEKTNTGHYHGMALALWHDIAEDMGLTYDVREFELEDLLRAIEKGDVDVGVSALSITPERESAMDFSQPFYYTGLGIAVPARNALDRIETTLGRVFSEKVLAYVGSLLVLLFVVGALVWAVERRHNPGHFRPGRKGLGDGLWWSAVTMTSVGYGDATPKTLLGRSVALVWMFVSVALLASFTAGITSLLTVESLGSSVRDPDDLKRVRVGVVRDASAAEEFTATHIGYRTYETLEDGLRALESGTLDAFVHDRPILLYCQAHENSGRIQVLPGFFDPQLYGFAFPRGSTLRKVVNIALLRRMEDYAYRRRVFGPYLGKAGIH